MSPVAAEAASADNAAAEEGEDRVVAVELPVEDDDLDEPQPEAANATAAKANNVRLCIRAMPEHSRAGLTIS
jgi:NAD(P)H-dependent FMN reductase